MRYLRASIAWVLSLGGCSRATPLSPAEFTEHYAAALKKAEPELRIMKTADLELRLTRADGQEQTAFLHNCYAEYRLDPKLGDELIARHVRSFSSAGKPTDDIDAAQIVPIIKDRAWLDEVRATLAERGSKELPEHVYDLLNEDLAIVYAVDRPNTIQYLTLKQLEAAKVGRKELRTLAVSNLRRLLPKVEARGGNGVFMLSAGGSYEACLLLLDDIWRERKLEVSGAYVVAIPSRDLLLVCGSEDAEALGKLRELAQQTVAESPYHLTSQLFMYKDGEFVRFGR